MTTQWRGSATGFAGDPNARTPQADALALAGVAFAGAVTPHPFGPFARAALFTGRRSPENGIVDYFDPLPTDAQTIAHRLNEAGYLTAFFGKWHLAPRDRHVPLVGEAHARMLVPPERRGGFSFWEGFEGGFLLNDIWVHGTRLPEPALLRGYQSDVLCSRASEWIGSQGRRAEPWFCVLSLEPPHPPYAAPAAGISSAEPETLVLPPNVPRGTEAEAIARRELAGYYAHIAATDRAIGRLLATIDRDVIVVLTSVHGDMHGAHGRFRKGWPYEESVRVPLVVRAPGGSLPANGHDGSAVVSLTDVFRWTLAWSGGTVPELTSRESGWISMPSVVALPHQCDRVWRGVRTARRKLVVSSSSPGGAMAPWLFFDLEADPWEHTNLVNDPARAGEIAGLLDALPPD